MATAFTYTVLSGDTISSIAQQINACEGVTYQAIEAANPSIPPSNLQVGQVITVPGKGSNLMYTVQPGDSYYAIATNINAAVGVTTASIEAANPNVDPGGLQIGQQLAIPDGAAPPAPVKATYMGYWLWTYNPGAALPDANLGIAFSGFSDVSQAITDSATIVGQLQGTPFISFGGGDPNTGYITSKMLSDITSAIASGQLSAYQGIAYDVEEGDSGLAADFQASFAAAKKAGFKVLVTVSHSAPYGISDAYALMQSFFADPNIDFLSPQLYTSGSETTNDFATTAGVTWNQYANAKAKVIPSVVKADMYPNAQATFKTYGVDAPGYVQWSKVS